MRKFQVGDIVRITVQDRVMITYFRSIEGKFEVIEESFHPNCYRCRCLNTRETQIVSEINMVLCKRRAKTKGFGGWVRKLEASVPLSGV